MCAEQDLRVVRSTTEKISDIITKKFSPTTNQPTNLNRLDLLTPKWQNLEITSPHPVAPLRYYLWQLTVLAMSTPLRSTLFEEYTFTPSKVIIIFPFCQTYTLSMGTSVLTTAFIAPALLDLEI